MSTTFLELSTRLAEARTEREKKKITQELSSFLGEERDFSETLIRPMMLSVIDGLEVMNTIMSDEFFSIRQRVYRDDDKGPRIALGVSFLQDYQSPVDGLDELVLESVLAELKRQNLDLLVNDVAVNMLQFRDGALTS